MLIVYNGPHPEVVVDELDQSTVIVAGQPVEIPDPLAARLLEQSTWEQAVPVKPAPASPQTPAQGVTDTKTPDGGTTQDTSTGSNN